MKGKAITILAVALMGASAMVAQEVRNEVSVQGTGFFTRNVDNQGFTQRSTDSGGVLAGYRFNINRWLSAEANYGFTRTVQGTTPAYSCPAPIRRAVELSCMAWEPTTR